MIKHSEGLCQETWNELDIQGRMAWLSEANLERRKQFGLSYIDWAVEFWEDLPKAYRERLSKFMERCLE